MSKVTLTPEEKAEYVRVAQQEFVRIGTALGLVNTNVEAGLPKPPCAFVFLTVNEESSNRFSGGTRFNARVANQTTNQTAYLRFGFGVNFNVPLASEWFEEDRQGKPLGLKRANGTVSKTELLFLKAVLGAILEQTDPAASNQFAKYLNPRNLKAS